MHGTFTRRSTTAAALVATALLAGCADGVEQNSLTGPASIRAELSPGAGYTSICKAGPAGTYHFTVTVSGGGDYDLPRGSDFYFTLLSDRPEIDPACGYLYLPKNPDSWTGKGPATVTLTELDLPTGMQVSSVSVYNNGALQSTATGTNSAVANPTYSSVWLIKFVNGDAPPPPPPGGQGCTPGFWKNSTGSWALTGIATADDFDAEFGVDIFDPNVSLLRALSLGGGGRNALARHATAALLASSHPGVAYPISASAVRTLVQNAYATGNYEAAKNTLAAYNELGCPLANGNSF